MKPNYNTKINRIHSKPEDYTGINSQIDLTGYVPKEFRIALLIEAGKRLTPMLGTYDVIDSKDVDISDLQCDPIRRKNFDMAEGSEIVRAVKADIKAKYPSRSVLGQLTPEGSTEKTTPESKPGKKTEENNDTPTSD
ncbi:MAG: hypothetical protein [Arizlama microvirus]|nr:MAG: hypothetical protein [Arizlama microvirus]